MKRIDIQVNGGSGLLFNSIKNLDDFLKIELNHLKHGKTFIIPTFITDSDEKLKNFVKIVSKRLELSEKQYKIDKTTITLPKLWGIHIEGPFITNKGTHPERYLKDFNAENVNNVIEILKPLGQLPIIITIAPELILKDIKNRAGLLKKLKGKLNVTISAGHTKISKDDFKLLQEKLGEDRFKQLTHLHNAMLEGHFRGDDDGIPSYLIDSDFDGYFGLVADGQHTSSGELLPTLLNYPEKVCIISDCAAPACCTINENNNLSTMGGNIGVVKQKPNQLPNFFWTDFSKNPSDEVRNRKVPLEKLYEMYINGEGGYKTLAGSAVNLDQCHTFLKNLDIKKELEKSKSNPKAKRLLEVGLAKNNLDEKNIKDFINKNLERMFFENQIKAINIDSDINNYEIEGDKLLKNGKVFIDFDNDFNDFLEQFTENQDELKSKIIEELKGFI